MCSFNFLFLSGTWGATLLLSSFPTCVKHVIYAAFDRHEHGKQLVSMLTFWFMFMLSIFAP